MKIKLTYKPSIMINVLIIDKTEQIKSEWLHVEMNTLVHFDDLQALIAIETYQPSVILLNYNMRYEATIDYIKLILDTNSDNKIVVIADELDEETKLDCLIAGAKGYQNIKQLEGYAKKLVEVVDAGEIWISRQIVSKLLDKLVMATPSNEFKRQLRLA